ncbi:hypothetical protein KYC5002_25095 [Archangium violaceum]|uniref:hypothetical protein n=1 Tax=Archangium violaceum TaxID=83451 RepID=UPI002B2C4EB2|nr:hypothetical protein KYC5002_25095 [Archangium gephyra]
MLMLPTLLLAACGGVPESEVAPAEEPLGTRESAMCSGLSVTSLTLDGISTYEGELAGAGTWSVSTFANAVSLEFYVDGQTPSTTERLGSSGTWSYSRTGVACGPRTFEVRAYPMVVASDGTKTICRESYKSATRIVTEPCPPTASISCNLTSGLLRCTGSASGGSGSYTPQWQGYWNSYHEQTEYLFPWIQGMWISNNSCAPVSPSATAYDVVQLHFKVTDSNGVTSNTVSSPTYRCLPMH